MQASIKLKELYAHQGELMGVSQWITIDQKMIDGFAQVTGDDAFIHTDPGRAVRTRFGSTIAHGLLVLSLLPYLMRSGTPAVTDRKMGVNYGYDRIRFTTPVPVDRQVRGRFTLGEISERKPGFHLLRYSVDVEMDGTHQLVLSAQWRLGMWTL